MKLTFNFALVALTTLFVACSCGGGSSQEENVDLSNFQYGTIPSSYSVRKITSDITATSLLATEIIDDGTVVGFWSQFIGAGGGATFYSGFIAPSGNQAFFPETGSAANNNLRFTDISGNTVLEAFNRLYDIEGSFIRNPSTDSKSSFHLNAINSNNLIVGNIDSMAVIVFNDGRTGMLQGTNGFSIASDLNDNNVMVGRTSNGDDVVGFSYRITDSDINSGQPVLKTSDRIGTFGGRNSRANAINNVGLVVGEADTATNFSNRAFVYHASIGLIDLGTFGGIRSGAQDINESGIIVGHAENQNRERRAFVGTPDEGLKDLNSLVPDMGEVTLTEAHLINNNGVIAALGESGEQSFFTKAIYLLEPIS